MSKISKRLSTIGKPAFKFKFTVLFEYVEMTVNKDWRPNELHFMWHRGQRQRTCPVPMAMMQTESIPDSPKKEKVIVSWEESTSINLLVTLYKDGENTSFKKKEYTFVLEDIVGPTKKRLAIFPLNVAQYASMEYESIPLDMDFRCLSNKVSGVMAGLQIRCEFIKTGHARDIDMESNFSHISDEDHGLSDGDNRMNDFDFEFLSPLKNGDSGVMQSRATLSNEQIMKELNISEKQFTHARLDSNDVDNNDQMEARLTKRSDARQEMVETRVKKLSSATKVRHHVSALVSGSSSKPKVAKTKSKKPLTGTLRAFLHGKNKPRRSVSTNNISFECDQNKFATLPTDLHRSFDEEELPSSRTTFLNQKSIDESEFALESQERIRDLEEENLQLRSHNDSLTREVGLLQNDVVDLQSEVGELQFLVDDLRTKLNQSELTHRQVETEAQELLLRMSNPPVLKLGNRNTISKTETVLDFLRDFFKPTNPSIGLPSNVLRGWLCKRGVKGGPLGRRWKRRWFSVDEVGRLYYYKRSNNSMPSGFIELERILATEDVPPSRQDKNNASFDVVVEGRCYELMAHDEEEKERWINALDYLKSWRMHVSSLDVIYKERKE